MRRWLPAASASASGAAGIAVGEPSRSPRLQQGGRSDADIAVQTGASPGRGRVVGARSRAPAGRRVQAAGRAPGARHLRRTSGHPPVMSHRSVTSLPGTTNHHAVPPALWHRWLGDRNGIRPVKSLAPAILPEGSLGDLRGGGGTWITWSYRENWPVTRNPNVVLVVIIIVNEQAR